jgi:hypothetical protein
MKLLPIPAGGLAVVAHKGRFLNVRRIPGEHGRLAFDGHAKFMIFGELGWTIIPSHQRLRAGKALAIRHRDEVLIVTNHAGGLFVAFDGSDAWGIASDPANPRRFAS